MTPFRLLGTLLVCLATGTLSSAQTVTEVETALRDKDYLINWGVVFVTNESGADAAYHPFPYSRRSDGPFESAARKQLEMIELNPFPGHEADDYWLVVRGSSYVAALGPGLGDVGVKEFSGREKRRFKLEKSKNGFALGPEAYNFTLNSDGGVLLSAPSVTDYEVRTYRNGEVLIFSTANGRDDFNKVPGSTCELSTVLGFLREKRILLLNGLFWTPQWDRVEVTLYEGSRATTIVLREAVPKVRLTMRLNEGMLYLTVSGEDAANCEIEEGPTLRGPWGPSTTLLRPPRPSSFSVGEYEFPIAPEGPMRFYRPKASYSPAVQ